MCRGGKGERTRIDEIRRALWESSEPMPDNKTDRLKEKARDIVIHGDGNVIVMNVMMPKEA